MPNLPLDNKAPRDYAEALRRLPYGQIELLNECRCYQRFTARAGVDAEGEGPFAVHHDLHERHIVTQITSRGDTIY